MKSLHTGQAELVNSPVSRSAENLADCNSNPPIAAIVGTLPNDSRRCEPLLIVLFFRLIAAANPKHGSTIYPTIAHSHEVIPSVYG